MTRRLQRLSTTMIAIAAAAVPAAAPGTALAAAPPPVDGPYVSLGAGYNLLQDVFTHPRLSPENQPAARSRFGEGFVGAGSVGWGLGNGLRLELEGAYDYNVAINSVPAAVPSRSHGNQGTYGVFANAFYDIDLTEFGTGVDWVQPYVGIGAGVLWTHFAITSAASDNSVVFRTGGTGANFAYQGIVGFGFPVASVPGLKLLADYRLIGIQANSGAVGEAFTPAGVSKGTVGLSPVFLHQFTIGVAYAFNAAPPPPPPAPVAPVPVAQPVRTYLVFFDWDRAELSDRARAIVSEAAQASTRVQTTRIEVDGYTDLSGTAAYNQGLSVRRAEAVEAELVRDGVARAEIVVQGFGERNPLVPTAQGVREPQNRRVEIILR